MNKFIVYLCLLFCVCGCDLQPKLLNVSNNIEEFLDTRYPALLADPETQSEIYNSAVSDYGKYQISEIYGSELSDDYILYVSPDDYIIVELKQTDKEGYLNISIPSVDRSQEQNDVNLSDYVVIPAYSYHPNNDVAEITVQRGDTLYSISRQYNVTIKNLISLNNLKQPYNLYAGQKIIIKQKSDFNNVVIAEKTAVNVQDKVNLTDKENTTNSIIVKNGDTLYSLSKKYSVPQEDLITLNHLHKPYKLYSGQKLLIVATQTLKLENKKQQSNSEVKTVIKKIPLREIHVVAGDTLYSLSRKYKIPVNDIAVLNDLKSPFVLRSGQVIKVPNFKNAENDKIVNKSKNTKEKTLKVNNQRTKLGDAVKVSTNGIKQKNVAKYNVNRQTVKTVGGQSKIIQRSSSKFSWPVRGKIVSYFGSKSNGLFNDGINISAQFDSPVVAAENGRVAYAGNEVKGMGNLVMIQHADGWITVYAHLNSMIVQKGDIVKVNQKIGAVGATGKVVSPELHFEIRKGKKAYNPSKYLK